MPLNVGSLPDLIPAEALLGNPEKIQPQLSPDGTRMAYIAPLNDVLNVWVGAVGKDDYKPVTKDTDRGIPTYFWAYDNKHLLYIQDVGGDENWMLYAVNLETGDIRNLTPFEKVQAQVVSRSKDLPDEILVGINKDNPQAHDVYRLLISTGELTKAAENPGNILEWKADRDQKVRAAVAATEDGGFDLMHRKTEQDPFEKLISWGPDDALGSGPVGFNKAGDAIFLQDSRNANASRLVKLDIGSKKVTVIAEDPQYDVGGVFTDLDTYEPLAVAFTRDRNEWVVLDDSIKGDFEAIKGLHHGDFFVVNRDLADKTWLVAFTADNGPIPYFAFDRATQKATFLFDHSAELKKYELTSVEPFEFASRDGLTVHGYLAFPKGSERKNLPTVLNVHGGPWHRDVWGFDPETQLWANRGYLVIQINFRGSTGYGKDFLNAGNREWGGKMHDDLIDGVNWAIEKGYADSKKIAIYGGSYGGFAALVGATFTPDVFCCAVDIVGVSNIITWINTIPPYWKPMLNMFKDRVGDPEKDEEFLKSRSPLFKVDQIKIPMLIAQGANDPRVPQAESEQVVAALKEKGIEHQYMLFEDEGHGFAKPENRLKFYAAAEKFLAKHLGGRAEGDL